MIKKINNYFLENVIKKTVEKSGVSEEEVLEILSHIMSAVDSYLNENSGTTIKIELGNYEIIAERIPERRALHPIDGRELVCKARSYISIKMMDEDTPQLFSDVALYDGFKLPFTTIEKITVPALGILFESLPTKMLSFIFNDRTFYIEFCTFFYKNKKGSVVRKEKGRIRIKESGG